MYNWVDDNIESVKLVEGKLYDGITGNENFERDPSAWVGWRRGEEQDYTGWLLFNIQLNKTAQGLPCIGLVFWHQPQT